MASWPPLGARSPPRSLELISHLLLSMGHLGQLGNYPRSSSLSALSSTSSISDSSSLFFVCGDNHNTTCIIHVYYVGFVWINNLWRVFVCIIWGCPSQLRAETTKVWIPFSRPANLVADSNLQVKQAGRHKSKNLRRANGGREKQTQVWINPHWPSNLRPWAPPRPQASWCRQGTTITARSLHFAIDVLEHTDWVLL